MKGQVNRQFFGLMASWYRIQWDGSTQQGRLACLPQVHYQFTDKKMLTSLVFISICLSIFFFPLIYDSVYLFHSIDIFILIDDFIYFS